MLEETDLQPLLEALIMASSKPLSVENLLDFFSEEEKPTKDLLKKTLQELQENYENRGIRLVELASGYQFQVEPKWHPWVGRLWEEKAPRYSRALFETLALIAYRQPITRGEIEDIRGVSLSTSIFKTLMEDREWIRIVGHREVPGRPALYATTKHFLDYFGLKTLEQLPSLPEIMNIDAIKGMEEGEIPSEQRVEGEEVSELEEEGRLKTETDEETAAEATEEELEKNSEEFEDMLNQELQAMDFEDDESENEPEEDSIEEELIEEESESDFEDVEENFKMDQDDHATSENELEEENEEALEQSDSD